MDLIRVATGGLVRRRRGLRAERGTLALTAAATAATAAVGVAEWRRIRTRHPSEHVGASAREAVGIVAAGYRTGTPGENALFNLLASSGLTFAAARLSTWSIHHRGARGPFRNLVVSDRHVHHFIPGIVMAFLAGGISVASRDQRIDPWLAVPFGAGVALTLDESALLLELDDVYWSEGGIVSVQITLTALLMLSGLALGLRLLRRGEAEVL